jgi:hypothetical protein
MDRPDSTPRQECRPASDSPGRILLPIWGLAAAMLMIVGIWLTA